MPVFFVVFLFSTHVAHWHDALIAHCQQTFKYIPHVLSVLKTNFDNCVNRAQRYYYAYMYMCAWAFQRRDTTPNQYALTPEQSQKVIEKHKHMPQVCIRWSRILRILRQAKKNNKQACKKSKENFCRWNFWPCLYCCVMTSVMTSPTQISKDGCAHMWKCMAEIEHRWPDNLCGFHSAADTTSGRANETYTTKI